MDYYVAPTGSDVAAGTIGAPFATITHAVSVVTDGDQIFLRGGRFGRAGNNHRFDHGRVYAVK